MISLLHSTKKGKNRHETFVAPKPLGNFRIVDFPENSKVRKLQREREEKLKNLVDPHHVLQVVQFGYDVEKAKAWMLRKPRPAQKAERALGCEMPLTKSVSCAECKAFGHGLSCDSVLLSFLRVKKR